MQQNQRLKRIKDEINRNKYVYLMALPVLVYFIVFHYGAMYGAIIAFKKFDVSKGIQGSEWVGFKHFIDFFGSRYFWRLLQNTLILNGYELLFGFPAPILFALLLNELKNEKFKRTVQTVTYLPHFISVVVICGMINEFVSRDGLITAIFAWFGGEQTALLLHPKYFRTIFVSSSIWQNIGWGSIVYLAALSGIDQEMYEAARIDGAGRFKQIWYITIPSLIPTIIILFILRTGQILDVGFEKVILLYSPNTYEVSDVISSFVYRRGLGESFEYSYTTAVGLFKSTINFILLVSVNWLSRKTTDTSLW